MKQFKVLLSAGIFAAALSSALLSQAEQSQQPKSGQPLITSKASESATKHSLWKAEGKKSVVYLLGSVHILKDEDYPLPEIIDTAFTNSQVVAFETDIAAMEDPGTAMKILGKARLPEGETLKTELSPQVYEEFMKHLKDSGVPAMMVEPLRPAMAAMMLEVFELTKIGLNPEKGLDKHFFGLAREAGKEIVPLETLDFQISLITDFTKDEGDALMKATLKDLDKIKEEFADIVRAWKVGDSQKLDKMLSEAMTESPAIYKRLVSNRNHNWIPKIEQFMDGNKTAIVIVGAAHLVGKEGVVELLKAKGYKVTQQ